MTRFVVTVVTAQQESNMVEITNVKVYDLADCIVASGYAMGLTQEEFDGRVENLEHWLSLGDFLPNFISFYKNQNKNLGKNTKDSCLKCGSNLHVQRVNAGQGNGNYYCSKHCHILYRYGEIKDHVVYSFLPNNEVKIEVTGDMNITRECVISAVDVPLVFGKNIQINANGYLLVDGELFHRLLAKKLGVSFEQIDHIDRNPSNNVRNNLRPCTQQENLRNKVNYKSKNEDFLNGVSYRKDKNKWRAYITINKKQLTLGHYDKKDDAIRARLLKEKELFGAFSPNIRFFEEYGIENPNVTSFKVENFSLEDAVKDFSRILRLSYTPSGSGHRNALKGIRVSFDIKYPSYFTPELQRYSFMDIVTSSSKMHRLVKMDMDACFNQYVLPERKAHMKFLIGKYNENPSYEMFMTVLSNCPLGIELFMRCSTNYEQLATIYRQRKNHRLREDWVEGFCKDFIEKLPYAKELIICKDDE